MPDGTWTVPAPVKIPEKPDHQAFQNAAGSRPVISGMADYFRMRRILAIQRFAAEDPFTNLFPLRAEAREVGLRETERVRDEPLVRLRLRPPFEDFERVAFDLPTPRDICPAIVCEPAPSVPPGGTNILPLPCIRTPGAA